jgi:alkylhydroperoxidase family enzyme
LIRQLSTDDTFGPQVALLTARTNGSATCFDAWLDWQGEEAFASHLREGDQALHRWLQQHPQARLVTAVQLLTRSPDRFSAAQLTPLAEYGLSAEQAIDLLTWSGLCGWMNRLKIALGNVRQQT